MPTRLQISTRTDTLFPYPTLSRARAVMSTDTVRANDQHAEGTHDEAAHGTLKGYLTGFGLSVVLTAIPFWIVMSGAIADRTAAARVVLAFAFVQIVVQIVRAHV